MKYMNTKSKIRFILGYMKPYKLSFISLFITLMTVSTIDMIYPFLMSLLVDEVFYNRNLVFLKFLVICYLILFITNQLIFFIQHFIIRYLNTRFLFDIRKDLFDRILMLKPSILTNIKTGDLITTVNNDVDVIMDLIFNDIYFSVADILRLGIIISLVAFLNKTIALLLIIIVPINVYVSKFFGKKINDIMQNYRKQYGTLISWVFEIIKGIREVKLLGGEKNVLAKFMKNQSSLLHLKIKSSYVEVGCERTNAFVSFLASIVIYIVASLLIVKGNLTIGAFIAIIDYFTKATRFFSNINNRYIHVQASIASIDKSINLLNEDAENIQSGVKSNHINNGVIQYNNVNFGYNDRKILNNINLQINPGDKIALVGKSGSGKSTMVNILLRLYEVKNNSIYIDGVDINSISMKSLRDSIGIVQQESLFFDGSLRENLTIVNRKCSEEEIWSACEKAYIAQFIRSLPNGLDTLVGMGGISLSGGQKQRIAIARIFIKNAKILILDESTSALDSESEQYIYRSLKKFYKNCTTIMIAHRISTVMEADKVAVLANGTIVACDKHSQLLKYCEEYRNLFQEQYFSEGGNFLDKGDNFKA